MRIMFLIVLFVSMFSGGSAFAGKGDFIEYQQILDSKCSQCHPRARIEQAIERGDNFTEIIEKMIRFGAQLSSQEQQVLGVFWTGDKQAPVLETSAGVTVSKDPLGEYRAVLESRCTACHTLDRVEAAMMEGRSIKELVEMMRKRGAIVTESDFNALAPFWGSPYKEK